MKKNLIVLLTLSTIMTATLFTGCGSKDSGSATTKATTFEAAVSENTTNETTTPEATTPEVTTQAATTNAQEENQTLKDIEALIPLNRECGIGILMWDLPYEDSSQYDPNDESTYILKVTDSRFKSYDDLKNYVESIYSSNAAKKYLTDYPEKGNPKYVNKNGDLYINTTLSGAKGYYVDWSNPTVVIDEETADTCKFTVTVCIEEPSDNPVQVPYKVSGTAVKENGKWLLADILY